MFLIFVANTFTFLIYFGSTFLLIVFTCAKKKKGAKSAVNKQGASQQSQQPAQQTQADMAMATPEQQQQMMLQMGGPQLATMPMQVMPAATPAGTIGTPQQQQNQQQQKKKKDGSPAGKGTGKKSTLKQPAQKKPQGKKPPMMTSAQQQQQLQKQQQAAQTMMMMTPPAPGSPAAAQTMMMMGTPGATQYGGSGAPPMLFCWTPQGLVPVQLDPALINRNAQTLMQVPSDQQSAMVPAPPKSESNVASSNNKSASQVPSQLRSIQDAQKSTTGGKSLTGVKTAFVVDDKPPKSQEEKPDDLYAVPEDRTHKTEEFPDTDNAAGSGNDVTAREKPKTLDLYDNIPTM